MSKAILIMDMPKNCYECKLQVHNMVGDHICAINHKNADNCASRGTWCPLKEVRCEVGESSKKKIIDDVIDERVRQDEKWGEQDHSAYVWSSIIGEEYGEMCKAINEFGFNPTPETEQDIYTEAIQTMASCMAMLEHIERSRTYKQTD